jgi:hypothetical protein
MELTLSVLGVALVVASVGFLFSKPRQTRRPRIDVAHEHAGSRD